MRELPVVLLGGADHVFQTSQHHNDQLGEASKNHIEFVTVDGYYTSPECMKGVPVTKLVEGDGYWKTPWKSLQDWSAGDKRRTSKTTTFFDRYYIHPNQLVAKKYYGDIGLFTALVPEVLRIIFERLGDFNVADPAQWLRSQLAHLIFLHETNGGSARPFSLRKNILEFRDKNPDFQILCLKHDQMTTFKRCYKLANSQGTLYALPFFFLFLFFFFFPSSLISFSFSRPYPSLY
jgi:hypothetical protein